MERPNAHGDYDPLAAIDHAGVCEDLYLSMNGDTSRHVRASDERQMHLQRPVFLTFEYVAQRMREVNENNTLTNDTTQIATFKSGAVFALELLERMAVTLSIDVDEFYRYWETSSVAVLPPDTGREQTEVQKIKTTTSLVKKIAAFHLENLPDEYMDLVKKSEINYVQIQDRTEIYRTGFGYVLGSGYVALQYVYERQKFGDIDFDSLLSLETGNPELPTHQSLADKFIRLIESGRGSEDMNLESIFGRVMQDNVDSHEQMFEVFHSLAIALYRKDGEPGMDDVTEAFFKGANLGAHIATDIAEGQLDNESKFIERWLKTRLHRELSKYGPDYHEHTRIDAKKALEKLRDRSAIPPDYERLLELIDEEQEYDNEDSAAFRDGFLYSLATFLREVEAQRKGDARRAAKKEVSSFDSEFDNFMRENDLTGGLQKVKDAYLGHCRSFGLDPDNLTLDEAETILELTLIDYDRLMPEISEIKVCGPSFLQFIDDDEEDGTSNTVLLQPRDSIKAEIAGFRLAVVPTDDGYTHVDTENSETMQFAVGYMPGFVLKNARITPFNGTESVMQGRIAVGFAVPGTTFQRVDF